ncbi:MAG: hypothetical protein K8R68_08205, partial [Bacteroidales bacterium]|nr:hypothetical protein [Bacteroidales bacterium]
MKKINLIIAMMIIAVCVFAQTPQAFKYQAVVRDNAGNILAGENVSIRISILHGSTTTTGFPVYVETHDPVTNQFGLVNLEIGNGNIISGDFENINWANELFFIQTEMDETGGTNYQLLGASQLLSVPYSFQSRSLILTDENGNEYIVSVDSLGNLATTMITGWACGDSLLDYTDGQKYATVLIGSQCWMAENLNVGNRIDGVADMTDNSIIEKYCYDNQESNCDTYGGLYQWDELMQYITTSGAQGICPGEWHIPTDNEWKILEGTVDSQFGVGDPVWNILGYRGFDAGLNLKSISGWSSGNGTDLYGFTALPCGFRNTDGSFYNLTNYTHFWSSDESGSNAWKRILDNGSMQVSRNYSDKGFGFSVRCIKDYTNQPPTQPSDPIPGDGSIDIGIDSDISWTCSDPDGNDLLYKIHFGTDPDPPFIYAGLTEATHDPGTLDNNTTYYWKVVAFDSYGDSAVSNIWSFTTEIETIFTCGDVLLDTRDGQSYNTVEIGTPCWLAENLNIGTRIDGTGYQTDNSIIEKYCYDNLESNCDTHGGMYQWNEMMQYTIIEGVQGICPPGWYIPTDDQWKILEGTVDSQFGIGDPMWNYEGFRGFDAGLNLKSTSGWAGTGNGSDLFG